MVNRKKLQIITAIQEDDDTNSLFLIKEGDRIFPCKNGENILCNSIIRLEHISTGKNIHSHDFPSFIIEKQESFIIEKQESCSFGENCIDDDYDSFKIICYKQKGKKEFLLEVNFFRGNSNW